MRLITTSLAAVVVTAAWHFAIPVANAQVETPSPGLSAPAPNITDQKLDAAAAALKRVAVLQQTYRQRLAQAPAQADKDRITAEADTALTNAVADQGLRWRNTFPSWTWRRTIPRFAEKSFSAFVLHKTIGTS
jgi:hypothetical protein